MNLLSYLVGRTDTCPFKLRNYFLALRSILNVYMSLIARGHSMDDIVNMLDIQGEDNDRFVTCFVKLFYGVDY